VGVLRGTTAIQSAFVDSDGQVTEKMRAAHDSVLSDLADRIGAIAA
jgi:hypothetical protein